MLCETSRDVLKGRKTHLSLSLPHLVNQTFDLMAGALVSILEQRGQELLPWNISMMIKKEPESSDFLEWSHSSSLRLLLDVCYILENKCIS